MSALAAAILCAVVLSAAVTWFRHPFAGVLVDPDGIASDYGLPSWEGIEKGLRYPDRIVSVEGQSLDDSAGTYRASVWDREVARAAAAGKAQIEVRVLTATGPRDLTLHLVPMDDLGWWVRGGSMVLIGLLYTGAAIIALAARPDGKLARTFAKTAILIALFLATVFDYHTTRRFVPVFLGAFALVPMSLFVLPLRLPDDVPLLRRFPKAIPALDIAGVALALGMIWQHETGRSTVPLRQICNVLLGCGLLFFAITFFVRFLLAKGDRRVTLRALLLALVPPYAMIGLAHVLAVLGVLGPATIFLAVPALALTPLASVTAFIRHDLWGSRTLLSRLLTRVGIAAVTCALAALLGGGFASRLGVPLGEALIAAGVASSVAVVLVLLFLGAGDRSFFPSRAAYKPTIERLSEDLTLVAKPADVAGAVEQTVLRWLPCEHVEFEAAPASEGGVLGAEEVGDIAIEPAPGKDGSLELPVLFRRTKLGTLRVGKKRGGALYTSEDIDLLRTIANQGALALAHARSYAELELRRKQQEHAFRSEREALVETVAAEIAHEVRYPINFFRSVFKQGATGLLDAEDIEIGMEEVERLERLVSGLKRVAIHHQERREVGLREIVQKVELLLRDRLNGRSLNLESQGRPAAIMCDLDQVTQVLVNLVSNGLDAAGDDGEVGVTWDVSPNGAVLRVWDSGPGFEGDPNKIFAPWFTTKARGTGLGLAITQRIVRAHGWTIDPERKDGRTYFVIRIQAADVVSKPVGQQVKVA